MISQEEYQALISILQRAPITPAEVVALQTILPKLQPAVPEPEEDPNQARVHRT